MNTRTITLPTEQWETILEAVQSHWDEGPACEGWQSAALAAASDALSTALAQPELKEPAVRVSGEFDYAGTRYSYSVDAVPLPSTPPLSHHHQFLALADASQEATDV